MQYLKIEKNILKCTKKLAFTLAEVLITLGIIGVVAALTIPSLLNKTNNTEFVVGLNKAVSIFSNSLNLLKIDNGGSLANAYSTKDNAIDAFCSNLKCAQICYSTDDQTKCYHSNDWYMLDGRSGWQDYSTIGNVSAILADGMIFSMGWTSTCNVSDGGSLGNIICASLTLDINGFKGPNKMGRDMFEFYIAQDKLVPNGSPGTFYATLQAIDCNPNVNTGPFNGCACAGKVLSEGAMNY